MDKFDEMNQFRGVSRGHGKIIHGGEKIRKSDELDDQAAFCKRLKTEFPGIMYESDLSSGSQRTPFWQNLILILKSEDKFPDVTIYLQRGGYIGCKLEFKALSVSPFLKDGSLSNQDHIQKQHACHEKLRAQGWFVSFVVGREQAWKIFLEYYNLNEN